MTELTKAQIMERGIELPDQYTFYVEDFEMYSEDLKGLGGVYEFRQADEGSLYVGMSEDLWTRLGNHIRLYEGGNGLLQRRLQELTDVWVVIYPEENMAWRELYESYLIIKENPQCNLKKVNIDTKTKKKPKRKTKAELEQEEWEEEQLRREEMTRLFRDEGVSLSEIAEEFGITEQLAGNYIARNLTDEEAAELF